jgi:hypothetical protein
VDVDELNTEYMYPDLGMPWNDWYLEHIKIPPLWLVI